MYAIEVLKEEHCLMRRVLDGLERLLQDARHGDELDGEAAADIVAFLEAFADGRHQDKEERALFPRLLVRSPPRVRARIAGLLATHVRERALLDELRGHLEGAAYGDRWSLDGFVRSGGAYLDLQRRHATQEDRTLFPVAERWLTRTDDREIVARFREVEAAWAAGGRPDPGRLAKRILGPRPTRPPRCSARSVPRRGRRAARDPRQSA